MFFQEGRFRGRKPQLDVGASALEFILRSFDVLFIERAAHALLRERDFGALRLKPAVGKMWKGWGRAW